MVLLICKEEENWRFFSTRCVVIEVLRAEVLRVYNFSQRCEGVDLWLRMFGIFFIDISLDSWFTPSEKFCSYTRFSRKIYKLSGTYNYKSQKKLTNDIESWILNEWMMNYFLIMRKFMSIIYDIPFNLK